MHDRTKADSLFYECLDLYKKSPAFCRRQHRWNAANALTLDASGCKNRPIDLQIWYPGHGTLVVNSAPAVVYAPNATVKVSHEFFGAIVADRITASGTVSFDTSLPKNEFE
jgi:hypothetical protein